MNIIDNYSEKTERGIATFVQAPAKRLINFITPVRNANYYLSFPHIVHRLEYSVVKIASAKHFLKELYSISFAESPSAEKLYLPPLPNVFANGSVCLGDGIKSPSFVRRNASVLLENNVRLFWKSVFNHQLNEARAVYFGNSNPMYELHHWQAKTKSDPLWIPGEDDLILMGSPVIDFIDENNELEDYDDEIDDLEEFEEENNDED